MISSKDLLRRAYEYAAEHSTDPSTWNGAVIFQNEKPFYRAIFGANHFPKGVKETPERWERPLKYSYVEHAERNAIYAAARVGMKTQGATMFCPWFACDNCARAIIQAGIVKVVGLQKPFSITPPHWTASIDIANEMLAEAGIIMEIIDVELGIEVLFNGQKVMM
jgi:dCMP deaminase